MDDLLKAYAKKRQADAGAPMELYPATRRILQAEAARLRPAPVGAAGSWRSVLTAFWPRLAFAAAVLLLGGFTAIHFFQGGNNEPGEMQLAKQDAVRIGTDRDAQDEHITLSRRQSARAPAKPAAGPLPALAGDEKSGSSLRREMNAGPEQDVTEKRDFAETVKKVRPVELLNPPASTAAPREVSQLATTAAPASEPASRISPPADALTLNIAPAQSKDKEARGANEGLAANVVSGPAQNGLLTMTDAMQPLDSLGRSTGGATVTGQAPAAPAQLAYFSKALADQPSTDPNARARPVFSPAAARPAVGKAVAAYSGTNVLANFVVEQVGDQLRVVDGDGSVYEGKLLLVDFAAVKEAEPPAAGLAGGRQDPSDAARAEAGEGRKQPLARANTAEQNVGDPGPTTWNFRVSGTNRTLKQPVIVDGVLFETPATNDLSQGAARAQEDSAPYSRNVQLQPAVPSPPKPRGYSVADSPARAKAIAAGGQAYGAQSLNLQNALRIQGSYRLGATNRIPLDAVRQANQP